MRFANTPITENAIELGIAGFPGDLDFGHMMYENWQSVDIDLVKTNSVLKYKIDTTGGRPGNEYPTIALF
jgi:V8-like Glu-specific endopeptidase